MLISNGPLGMPILFSSSSEGNSDKDIREAFASFHRKTKSDPVIDHLAKLGVGYRFSAEDGYEHKRRVIYARWPNHPDSNAVAAEVCLPKQAHKPPNGMSRWGATLLDFYYFEGFPGTMQYSSGGRYAAWARKTTPENLDWCRRELDWADLEPAPQLIKSCDPLEFLRTTYDHERSRIFWDLTTDQGNLKATSLDREKFKLIEDTLSQYEWAKNSLFLSEHFLAPWPLDPFSYKAPKLQSHIPMHRLPKNLVVHDPWNVLAVSDHQTKAGPYTWGKEDDVVQVYTLQDGKGKGAAPEDKGSTFLLKGPYDLPPFLGIKVPSLAASGPHSDTAHLYLSPTEKVGTGHHSVVYDAELEIPRTMFSEPRICDVCTREKVFKDLCSRETDQLSRAEMAWLSFEYLHNRRSELHGVEHDESGSLVGLDDEDGDSPVDLSEVRGFTIMGTPDDPSSEREIVMIEKDKKDDQESEEDFIRRARRVLRAIDNPLASKPLKSVNLTISAESAPKFDTSDKFEDIKSQYSPNFTRACTLEFATPAKDGSQSPEQATLLDGKPLEAHRDRKLTWKGPTFMVEGVDPVICEPEMGPWCPHYPMSRSSIHFKKESNQRNDKTGWKAPPVGRFRVCAKLSLKHDEHLAREAKTYQQFPQHLSEHWSGYTIIGSLVPALCFTGLREPVPLRPVVPNFYGYYEPTHQGFVAKDSQEIETTSDYLSPILLVENCGVPLTEKMVESFDLDDREEIASLFLRLNAAGFLHGSVFHRNVVAQAGPLEEWPVWRTTKEMRFRVIDFGRTEKTNDKYKHIEELKEIRDLAGLKYMPL